MTRLRPLATPHPASDCPSLSLLKDKGVTTVVTAERAEGTLTRHGLEEHVSDCVILLDHRVIDQRAIRRLRIVKYRGSAHSTNEFPFLINEHGFSVIPITSVGLKYVASTDYIPSGIDQLDTLLGGHGYYRGASVLVSVQPAQVKPAWRPILLMRPAAW